MTRTTLPIIPSISSISASFFALLVAIGFGHVIIGQSNVFGQENPEPIVSYEFSADQKGMVADTSKFAQPLNLKIENESSIVRQNDSISFTGNAILASATSATKVIDAVKKSGELSMELFLETSNLDQTGPARILTISSNTQERNLTVGQDGTKLDVRLRTSVNSKNGLPSIASSSETLTDQPVHFLFTRSKKGQCKIYINGVIQSNTVAKGDFSNWAPDYKLALGNELTKDRPWQGRLYQVRIYDRELSSANAVGLFRSANKKLNLVKKTADKKPNISKLANHQNANFSSPETNSSLTRVGRGLLVLYDFSGQDQSTITDRSGTGKPLHLKIRDPKNVRRSNGQINIQKPTILSSLRIPQKLQTTIQSTGAITVEAWIRPGNLKQEGPARILTISKNSGERNFTLGQTKDTFEVRMRTTKTSTNGIPSLSSNRKTAATKMTHVVYTHAQDGSSKIFINGKLNSESQIPGDTSNWGVGYKMAIGNELSNDRPWLGTIDLIAVYSRALSNKEVDLNFRAGPGAQSKRSMAKLDPKAHFFETKIAPILANHCLECHDASNNLGDLDLSNRVTAFRGGESGKAILPGKSGSSSLYELVMSDDMPADREPLSSTEKELLKKWIDQGASWSLDRIDPAVYVHSGSATGTYVQRLTVSEYVNTVRDSVGVDIGPLATQLLPPDPRVDGFTNTAYNLKVDLKHVQSYATLAEKIVDKMNVDAFANQHGLKKDLSEKSIRRFIESAGKWLLRGSLDGSEIARYIRIGEIVKNVDGDATELASYIIEAMLQSPRFIYRIEDQRGDGQRWPVTEFELANRMSYIIWGSSPDKELFDLAAKSRLNKRNMQLQIERMLADPRAIEQSNRFISEWLNLSRLKNIQPSKERFPNWNQELAKDMGDETIAFFNHLVWSKKRPLRELLNSQFTFATPRLAKHYGIDSKLKVGAKSTFKNIPARMDKYDLSSIPNRGGILTQGSLLTIGGNESSMVARGLFVYHDFLRGVVKDPPPCVDTTPVPTKAGLTQRDIALSRINNKNCGGCHSKFEPLAFGLEKFDGVGKFYNQDKHGNKLRDHGKILFPGESKPIAYKSSEEMMNLLSKNDRVAQSITWKMVQFSLGRPLGAQDAADVEKINTNAGSNGRTYQALIKELILSDLVQLTKTESQ